MTYAAALEGLRTLAGELTVPPGTPRRKFRLEDMRILLRGLGDPQLRFRSVLIAGTNGKGSTASTLASILAAAGHKMGLYTSPHLSRVNERVRILEASRNGQLPRLANASTEISNDSFAALYFQVDEVSSELVLRSKLPQHPSFFETMTALAFLHFAAEAVDIAVLEVGMGGRLDATNIVEPLVSVITDISLDHTEWLGPSIDAIAREKAGILRENGVMITLPQHREANEALGEIAINLGVRGVNAATYIPNADALMSPARNRYSIQAMGQAIEIDSPLAGHHQQRNIALAIATAIELCNSYDYKLDAGAIELGVKNTLWPGRLELFKGRVDRPDVLLDVGHNPAGAWALRSGISAILDPEDSRPLTLVFGCLRDKALAEMAQILFPLFDRVMLTEVDSPRTASLEDLKAVAAATGSNAEVFSSAEAALQGAFDRTPPHGLIVVAGSVYLVGRLRDTLTTIPVSSTSISGVPLQ
jgi:dihydrofolate synthase/folylpolyglutamate synthase